MGQCRLRRGNGETYRKLIGCLIAAAAIRAGASVLHDDSVFDAPARHAAPRIDCFGGTDDY